MQNNKDNNINNLIEKNIRLERQYDSAIIELHNTKDDYNELKQKYENTIAKMTKNERSIIEAENRVVVL